MFPSMVDGFELDFNENQGKKAAMKKSRFTESQDTSLRAARLVRIIKRHHKQP
jgi:hypothetical protein